LRKLGGAVRIAWNMLERRIPRAIGLAQDGEFRARCRDNRSRP
jgi:hypothetical protein